MFRDNLLRPPYREANFYAVSYPITYFCTVVLAYGSGTLLQKDGKLVSEYRVS